MKDRLRARRKELGLSLQAVADASNSSKSYIWELEKQTRTKLNPSAAKLADIAAALKTTVDYLLTGNVVGITETRLLASYAQLYLHNKVSLMDIADVLLRNQGSQVAINTIEQLEATYL